MSSDSSPLLAPTVEASGTPKNNSNSSNNKNNNNAGSNASSAGPSSPTTSPTGGAAFRQQQQHYTGGETRLRQIYTTSAIPDKPGVTIELADLSIVHTPSIAESLARYWNETGKFWKTRKCVAPWSAEPFIVVRSAIAQFLPAQIHAVTTTSISAAEAIVGVLLREEESQEGSMSVNGLPMPEHFRYHCGIVDMRASWSVDSLTVRENLMFAATMRRPTYDSAVFEERSSYLARLFHLDVSQKAERLTIMMRLRLDIAMELMIDPPVLILLHPFETLDRHSHSQLSNTLIVAATVLQKTVIVTMSSLPLTLVPALDTIMLLAADGHCMYSGPREGLFSFFNKMELPPLIQHRASRSRPTSQRNLHRLGSSTSSSSVPTVVARAGDAVISGGSISAANNNNNSGKNMSSSSSRAHKSTGDPTKAAAVAAAVAGASRTGVGSTRQSFSNDALPGATAAAAAAAVVPPPSSSGVVEKFDENTADALMDHLRSWLTSPADLSRYAARFFDSQERRRLAEAITRTRRAARGVGAAAMHGGGRGDPTTASESELATPNASIASPLGGVQVVAGGRSAYGSVDTNENATSLAPPSYGGGQQQQQQQQAYSPRSDQSTGATASSLPNFYSAIANAAAVSAGSEQQQQRPIGFIAITPSSELSKPTIPGTAVVAWTMSLFEYVTTMLKNSLTFIETYIYWVCLVLVLVFCAWLLQNQHEASTTGASQNIEGIFFLLFTVTTMINMAAIQDIYHGKRRYNMMRRGGVLGPARYFIVSLVEVLTSRTLLGCIVAGACRVMMPTVNIKVFVVSVGVLSVCHYSLLFMICTLSPELWLSNLIMTGYTAFSILFAGYFLNVKSLGVSALSSASIMRYPYGYSVKVYVDQNMQDASGKLSYNATALAAHKELEELGFAEDTLVTSSAVMIIVAVSAWFIVFMKLKLK